MCKVIHPEIGHSSRKMRALETEEIFNILKTTEAAHLTEKLFTDKRKTLNSCWQNLKYLSKTRLSPREHNTAEVTNLLHVKNYARLKPQHLGLKTLQLCSGRTMLRSQPKSPNR